MGLLSGPDKFVEGDFSLNLELTEKNFGDPPELDNGCGDVEFRGDEEIGGNLDRGSVVVCVVVEVVVGKTVDNLEKSPLTQFGGTEVADGVECDTAVSLASDAACSAFNLYLSSVESEELFEIFCCSFCSEDGVGVSSITLPSS